MVAEDEQIERDIAATEQEWSDLNDEVKTASTEEKAELEQRTEQTKADYSVRSSKLKQSWEVSQEVLVA